MSAISFADRVRVQRRLRAMLHSPGITLDPADSQGGIAQIRVGNNVLGTVDQVIEDGERSWAVTMIVLEEDLD